MTFRQVLWLCVAIVLSLLLWGGGWYLWLHVFPF